MEHDKLWSMTHYNCVEHAPQLCVRCCCCSNLTLHPLTTLNPERDSIYQMAPPPATKQLLIFVTLVALGCLLCPTCSFAFVASAISPLRQRNAGRSRRDPCCARSSSSSLSTTMQASIGVGDVKTKILQLAAVTDRGGMACAGENMSTLEKQCRYRTATVCSMRRFER